MTAHTVTVGALRTDVVVLAEQDVVAPLRARLDRALAEALPALLAEGVGTVLDGHDGVIRLRKLEVHLDHAGPFDETVLARLLAVAITTALRNALTGPGRDVAVWADHDEYLAAYVDIRLGLEAGPDWPFAEFTALGLLAPSEAVLALLRSRPGLLGRLAVRGAGRGDPTRLLSRLDDHACAALVDAVLMTARPAAPAADVLTGLVGSVDAAGDPPAAAPGRLPRAALGLLLRAAAHDPASDPVTLLRPAMALTALAERQHTLGEQRGGPLRAGDLGPALADSEPLLPARFRDALRAALASPPARAALADALQRPAGRPWADTRAPSGTAGAPRARPAPTASPVLASPVAGLALLLPGILRQGVHRVLTAPQLRAAALTVLGEEARDRAATDPLLATLFPADPHAPPGDVPAVPGRALARLAPPSLPLVTGRDGPEGWGDYLLADFASRLPGLGGSSRGYLQRQFLHTPGRLELSADVARVTLEGPALAVVLAMAGFDGAQETLPQLDDRLLTITLTGLRR